MHWLIYIVKESRGFVAARVRPLCSCHCALTYGECYTFDNQLFIPPQIYREVNEIDPADIEAAAEYCEALVLKYKGVIV